MHYRHRGRVLYDAKTDALRDEFTAARGIPPRKQIRLHRFHLGGGKMKHRGMAQLPPRSRIEPTGDWLLRGCARVSPPDVIARCASGEAGFQTSQSSVSLNFAVGRKRRPGGTLAEMRRKSKNDFDRPPRGPRSFRRFDFRKFLRYVRQISRAPCVDKWSWVRRIYGNPYR